VTVKNEHVHLFVPESDIPKAQAWYAKTFGGTPASRVLSGCNANRNKPAPVAMTEATWREPAQRPRRTKSAKAVPSPNWM
jgi:hypothetical protein